MSAPSARKTKKANGSPSQIPDMDPSDLMKAMGGNGWFNPISNNQVDWPIGCADEQKVPPSIYRMHAWLLHHSVTKGNRQPYANINGVEIHLENMATDLDIEVHNLRTLWRTGVRLGLWRGGTAAEGTRRLYPCATITPVAEPESENTEKGVCTNPLPDIFQPLPPYMKEQIEKLPAATIEQAAAEYDLTETIGKVAHAEVLATVRIVKDQRHDTLWRKIGIEKIRLNGAKKTQSPEELAEEAERQRRIDALLPHVQGYVQTLEGFVQTQKLAMYEPPTGSVQTPASEPLSPTDLPKSNGNGTVRTNGKTALPYPVLDSTKRGEKRAGGDSSGAHGLKSRPRIHDGEKPGLVHVPEPAWSAEETDAVNTFLTAIQKMQSRCRHTKFGDDPVDLENNGDRTWARNTVRKAGIEDLPAFIAEVKEKLGLLDVPALGKMPRARNGPAHNPHERFLGLISEWAGDFARAALKRKRFHEEEVAAAEKRAAFEDAMKQGRQREDAIDAALEQAWTAMSDEERAAALIAVEARMKLEPQWTRVWRSDTKARRKAAEGYARAELRKKIEAAP